MGHSCRGLRGASTAGLGARDPAAAPASVGRAPLGCLQGDESWASHAGCRGTRAAAVPGSPRQGAQASDPMHPSAQSFPGGALSAGARPQPRASATRRVPRCSRDLPRLRVDRGGSFPLPSQLPADGGRWRAVCAVSCVPCPRLRSCTEEGVACPGGAGVPCTPTRAAAGWGGCTSGAVLAPVPGAPAATGKGAERSAALLHTSLLPLGCVIWFTRFSVAVNHGALITTGCTTLGVHGYFCTYINEFRFIL